MLYGYQAEIDNKPATLVVSADTVEELDAWFAQVTEDAEKACWESVRVSNFLEMLRPNNPFHGYKRPVYAVFHADDANRDAFIKRFEINEQNIEYCRDRHRDMIHAKKVELGEDTGMFGTANADKTIAEIAGVSDEYDPWDKRSEEEKEQDKKLREKYEELEKKGKLSGESFGGGARKTTNVASPGNTEVDPSLAPAPTAEVTAEAPKKRPSILDAFKPEIDKKLAEDANLAATEIYNDLKANSGYTGGLTTVKDYVKEAKERITAEAEAAERKKAFVTDIRVKHNADGTINIDNVLASKRGGEVDEEAKQAYQDDYEKKVEEAKGGKKRFSPQDFAAVLRGDGRDDNYGIAGDKQVVHDPNAGTREGIKLSPEAEEARREYQEKQQTLAGKQEIKRDNVERAEEVKEKHEASTGVFRGTDLVGEEVPFEAFPEDVQAAIGATDKTTVVSHYPHNATLDGKYLIPFDSMGVAATIKQTININILGTVSVAGPTVAVCEKQDSGVPAWVIYTCPEGVDEIWVVKIR